MDNTNRDMKEVNTDSKSTFQLGRFAVDFANATTGATVKDVAKDMRISPATVSRLNNGMLPDIETFGKACAWMGKSPSDYFIEPINEVKEILEDLAGWLIHLGCPVNITRIKKTLTMHTLNNFLICPVPVGASMFHISDGRFDYDGSPLSQRASDKLCYTIKHWPSEIELPEGQWSVVCKGTEVDETLAAQMFSRPARCQRHSETKDEFFGTLMYYPCPHRPVATISYVGVKKVKDEAVCKAHLNGVSKRVKSLQAKHGFDSQLVVVDLPKTALESYHSWLQAFSYTPDTVIIFKNQL